MNETNSCPVCRARFRGAISCSRCGADLGRLMHLSAGAWRLREEARAAIGTGDFERASELAAQANGTQRTEAGEALIHLCQWMKQESADQPGS